MSSRTNEKNRDFFIETDLIHFFLFTYQHLAKLNFCVIDVHFLSSVHDKYLPSNASSHISGGYR